jgi:peptidyl-prolyl cis-trans isomerase B (cyclophilin B)
VAPSKNADREAREARERLRRYTAKQAVHEQRVTRRRRDNWIAVIVVVLVAALATLTQVIFFTSGPGAPKPSSSASAGPTPSSSPSASPSPSPSSTPAAGKNVGDVPSSTIAEGRNWTGDLQLNKVKLGIELDGKLAPQAASVFIDLVKRGFYTSTGSTCHRLTTSEGAKLIQCGSVNGDGTGDPGFSFGPLENVPANGVYPAGTIAMARTNDPFTQSSQFFITYADTTLDGSTGGYTVFGRVTSGLPDFISEIASKGVTGGGVDGPPVVATKITAVSVK